MSEKEYIITWLNKMVAKFEWITFRYEYSNVLLAHCIEVSPSKSLEESAEYAAYEYEFSYEFEREFDESVIFSDGTEFYRCSNDAITFSQGTRTIIEWINVDDFNFNLDEYVLDFQSDSFKGIESYNLSTCKAGLNYSFDLAA